MCFIIRVFSCTLSHLSLCFNLCLCFYSDKSWFLGLRTVYWAVIILSSDFPVFWGFYSVKESHCKNPSWMNINSGAVGNHTFFIIFGKEKIYFFLEELHPSAATHYCLPKCTKLARKQMFPITNDIYQLVSGLGLLQNWSSLEEQLWVTTGFLSAFKAKKCNGWYD